MAVQGVLEWHGRRGFFAVLLGGPQRGPPRRHAADSEQLVQLLQAVHASGHGDYSRPRQEPSRQMSPARFSSLRPQCSQLWQVSLFSFFFQLLSYPKPVTELEKANRQGQIKKIKKSGGANFKNESQSRQICKLLG